MVDGFESWLSSGASIFTMKPGGNRHAGGGVGRHSVDFLLMVATLLAREVTPGPLLIHLRPAMVRARFFVAVSTVSP